MEETQESHVDRLNKKRKIEDIIADVIQKNNFSIDDINEYCKSLARKFSIDWISILCSDWLSALLFPYLTLTEITKLDSAICYRKLRSEWLNRLKSYFPSVSLKLFDSIVWSDDLINWIVLRNLHFSELAIEEGYSQISNDAIRRLGQQCAELKQLKLFNKEKIEKDKRLQYLTAICDKLENIELLDCFSLSSEDCVWLGTFDQLESISVTAANILSAEHIKTLFKNKKKLKTLLIRPECDADVLLELGNYCPQLEHLEIEPKDMFDAHIEAFTQGCSKLKSLVISDLIYDFEPTDSVKDSFINSVGKNCHYLERLVLQSEWSENSNISEAALKSLAQGCPLLNTLYICDAKMLSAQGVKHLVENCLMLVDICFSANELSDDVLVELGKSKKLKSLDVSSCQQITDVGIDALVKENGSSLESLDINWCETLTDASLSSIGDHCPNLRTLNLGENHKDMSEVGIVRLARKCLKLVDVECSYCSIPLVEQLIDARKRLMQSK